MYTNVRRNVPCVCSLVCFYIMPQTLIKIKHTDVLPITFLIGNTPAELTMNINYSTQNNWTNRWEGLVQLTYTGGSTFN